MEHRGAVRVACWTVVGLLASIPAIADPVRITGGEFTASFTSSSFRFTGEGLSLSAIGGEGTEPASLLLIGTGLAGLAARKRLVR